MSAAHQSQLPPGDNKFHTGNGEDGKHYWLTPPDLYEFLDFAYQFTFDRCPYPKPDGFDGLTCEWGQSNYVNPPFGGIMHEGRKKGPTAWVRKAIAEYRKGKRVVLVYPGMSFALPDESSSVARISELERQLAERAATIRDQANQILSLQIELANHKALLTAAVPAVEKPADPLARAQACTGRKPVIGLRTP